VLPEPRPFQLDAWQIDEVAMQITLVVTSTQPLVHCPTCARPARTPIASGSTRPSCLPGYWYLDTAQQAEYDQLWPSYVEWQADAIQRFRTLIKNSQVVELDHSNHYVFLNDEATVVREMRELLQKE
jgi:hypothetical protein